MSEFSSNASCQQTVNDELDTYNLMVVVSLSLTAINLGLYGLCLRTRLQGSPRLASQFFYVTGTMKVLLGLLLWIVFLPGCPDGCTCSTIQANYLYPLIAILIGLSWIRRGNERQAVANVLEGGGGSEDTHVGEEYEVTKTNTKKVMEPHIFAPLPTNETV